MAKLVGNFHLRIRTIIFCKILVGDFFELRGEKNWL